jgi:cytochrome c556
MPRLAKSAAIAVAVLMLGGVSSNVLAQGAGAEDVIKARVTHMKEIGGSFKAIMDELKTPTPNPEVVKASAAKINLLVQQIPNWFPKGTGPESGFKTHAKAEIWTQPVDFKAAADRSAAASAELVKAASIGADAATLGPAIKDLGGSCGGCHKAFKEAPPAS